MQSGYNYKNQCLPLARQYPQLLDSQRWALNYGKTQAMMAKLAQLYEIDFYFGRGDLLDQIKVKTRSFNGESRRYKFSRDLLASFGTREQSAAWDAFRAYYNIQAEIDVYFEINTEIVQLVKLPAPLLYRSDFHASIVDRLCRIASKIIPVFFTSSYWKLFNVQPMRTNKPIAFEMLVALLRWYQAERVGIKNSSFPEAFQVKFTHLLQVLNNDSDTLPDFSFLAETSYQPGRANNSLKKLVVMLYPLMRECGLPFTESLRRFIMGSGSPYAGQAYGFQPSVLNRLNYEEIETLLGNDIVGVIPPLIRTMLKGLSPSTPYYFNMLCLLSAYFLSQFDSASEGKISAIVTHLLKNPTGVVGVLGNDWQEARGCINFQVRHYFFGEEVFSTLTLGPSEERDTDIFFGAVYRAKAAMKKKKEVLDLENFEEIEALLGDDVVSMIPSQVRSSLQAISDVTPAYYSNMCCLLSCYFSQYDACLSADINVVIVSLLMDPTGNANNQDAWRAALDYLQNPEAKEIFFDKENFSGLIIDRTGAESVVSGIIAARKVMDKEVATVKLTVSPSKRALTHEEKAFKSRVIVSSKKIISIREGVGMRKTSDEDPFWNEQVAVVDFPNKTEPQRVLIQIIILLRWYKKERENETWFDECYKFFYDDYIRQCENCLETSEAPADEFRVITRADETSIKSLILLREKIDQLLLSLAVDFDNGRPSMWSERSSRRDSTGSVLGGGGVFGRQSIDSQENKSGFMDKIVAAMSPSKRK